MSTNAISPAGDPNAPDGLNRTKTEKVAILLLPGFSMMTFAGLSDPMRLANVSSGKLLYSWQLASLDGKEVLSSTSIRVGVDCAADDLENQDQIILCGDVEGTGIVIPELFGHLRRWAANGWRIGSAGDGITQLAEARLLDGHECAVHWTVYHSLTEKFPDVQSKMRIFLRDQQRFSCAGGVSAVEMMIEEIGQKHGRGLAQKIAAHLVSRPAADGAEIQSHPLGGSLPSANRKLVRIIDFMQDNLEEPYTLDQISRQVGISRRQMERLFSGYLGVSPSKFYMKLRLDKTMSLLKQSAMPITEIALACGFVSPSHFSKCFRDIFGVTPASVRKESRQGCKPAPVDPDQFTD